MLCMLRIVPVLVVLASAAPAYAGLDCEADSAMKDVEAFAKDAAKAEQAERSYAWLCVEFGAEQLKPRIEKACLKILDRDGDKGECVIAAAAAGITKLGKHDIFALIGKLGEDPIESGGGIGYGKAELYQRMNDPRGITALIDMWTAAIPRADAREKAHRRSMADWSSWRQHAAAALGAFGDATAKTFLEEQSKATKDTHVRDACLDAAAAITKRIK